MQTREHHGRRDAPVTSFLAQSLRTRKRPLARPPTQQDALADERRRVASEVHDLIMQELSLALGNARALLDNPSAAPQARVVVSAGERALDGARSVLEGLTDHHHRTLVDAVRASVHAAARHLHVTFDARQVPTGVDVEESTRAALIHIGREAVTNAAKHSDAQSVEVVLTYGKSWHLKIRDDGHGFDARDRHRGFGLTSMAEHATALGGSLEVRSLAGEGTTVEAILP